MRWGLISPDKARALLPFFVLFFWATGAWAGDPHPRDPHPRDPHGREALHEQVTALLRRAQQMVTHGRHGHTSEMVQHAEDLAGHLEAFASQAEADLTARWGGQKEKALTLLAAARKDTANTIRLGWARAHPAALSAAHQVAFHLKRLRRMTGGG